MNMNSKVITFLLLTFISLLPACNSKNKTENQIKHECEKPEKLLSMKEEIEKLKNEISTLKNKKETLNGKPENCKIKLEQCYNSSKLNNNMWKEMNDQRVNQILELQSRLLFGTYKETDEKKLLTQTGNKIKKAYPEWVALWTKLAPGFSFQSFTCFEKDIYHRDEERYTPEEIAKLEKAEADYKYTKNEETGQLEMPVAESPDGKKYVVVEKCPSVDQQVMFVDNKRGRSSQIAFTGPGGSYYDVVWLDDEKFVITGEDGYGPGWRASLNIYDLNTEKVSYCFGPVAKENTSKNEYHRAYINQRQSDCDGF